MAVQHSEVDRADVREVDEVAHGHDVVVDGIEADSDDTSGEER